MDALKSSVAWHENLSSPGDVGARFAVAFVSVARAARGRFVAMAEPFLLDRFCSLEPCLLPVDEASGLASAAPSVTTSPVAPPRATSVSTCTVCTRRAAAMTRRGFGARGYHGSDSE